MRQGAISSTWLFVIYYWDDLGYMTKESPMMITSIRILLCLRARSLFSQNSSSIEHNLKFEATKNNSNIEHALVFSRFKWKTNVAIYSKTWSKVKWWHNTQRTGSNTQEIPRWNAILIFTNTICTTCYWSHSRIILTQPTSLSNGSYW